MVSLARSSLRHETRRYVPAVLSVAFAGLLIVVQIGLLLGMFRTATLVVDEAPAQLWATSPGLQSVDLPLDIPARTELRLMNSTGVIATDTLRNVSGDLRTSTGARLDVTVLGYSLRPGSVVWPKRFPDSVRLALRQPDAIAVDRADKDKLGVEVGSVVEINGHRAEVVALVSGFRAIGGVYVIASRGFVESLAPAGETVSYVAATVLNPLEVESLRDALQPAGENAQAHLWTAAELSRKSQLYWLLESGTGVGFLFSATLCLLVGLIITSQTLRAAVLSSIKEYATLRALGVPVGALRGVVMEQAFWIGLAGLVVTGVSLLIVVAVAKAGQVSIYFPSWTLLATVIFIFAMAFGAALLALRTLYRAEPAELLR